MATPLIKQHVSSYASGIRTCQHRSRRTESDCRKKLFSEAKGEIRRFAQRTIKRPIKNQKAVESLKSSLYQQIHESCNAQEVSERDCNKVIEMITPSLENQLRFYDSRIDKCKNKKSPRAQGSCSYTLYSEVKRSVLKNARNKMKTFEH